MFISKHNSFINKLIFDSLEWYNHSWSSCQFCSLPSLHLHKRSADFNYLSHRSDLNTFQMSPLDTSLCASVRSNLPRRGYLFFLAMWSHLQKCQDMCLLIYKTKTIVNFGIHHFEGSNGYLESIASCKLNFISTFSI